MCLAIYKKAGAIVPEEHLKNGFQNNTDGCGFCFVENQKVVVRKGMWGWEQFIEEYNKVPVEKAMLIHFRFETGGLKTEFNAHPFINHDATFACIHNGVINVKTSDGKSDTHIFAERVLFPMLDMGVPMDKPALKYLIETSIGSNNKILVMDSKENIVIYNESSGEWNKENTIWYSNTGYKYSRVRVYNHSSFDDDWNDRFLGSKKNQDDSKSGNGGCSGGDCGNNSTTGIDDKKEFSDEIELEINFCIKEMSFSRKDAIAYLVYEGVLEEDEATGEIKESDSNYSVVGM